MCIQIKNDHFSWPSCCIIIATYSSHVSPYMGGGINTNFRPVHALLKKCRRWTNINPLTAGVAYIRVFIFLLAHQVPPFKHVKDKMWHQSAIFENRWPPCCQIWIFSLTWSCGSRQRDTTSSKWKFRLNNLAVKKQNWAQGCLLGGSRPIYLR